MRIFKTKWFTQYTRRQQIGDEVLCDAIRRAEKGIIDADLGGGLIKQRIPRQGQGRSGGYRFLIAYRLGDRSIFLYGFSKSERDNIEDDDLAAARRTAAGWLRTDEEGIERAIQGKVLQEVHYESEKQET